MLKGEVELQRNVALE